MIGSWIGSPLEHDVEPPEAHWLRTVVKEPEWISITASLDAKQARAVEQHAATGKRGGRKGASGIGRLFAIGARLAQPDRALLSRAVAQGAGTFMPVTLMVPNKSAGKAVDVLTELTGVEVHSVEGGAGDTVHPTPSVPEDMLGPFPEGSVLTVIVDDGIAVANTRFRSDPTHTRVVAFLDMDDGDFSLTNCREIFAGEIDAQIRSQNGDEEQIYRALDMISPDDTRRQPLRQARSHGTHVLDLFSGFDYRIADERETALKRPIIAVQLPSQTIEERSDIYMPQALSRALRWILSQALAMNERQYEAELPPLPMVVNFSFGVFAGPKDGTGAVEREISAFLAKYRKTAPCEIVIPAGNGFAARSTARIALSAPGAVSEDLTLQVLPDDRTSSYVQIWTGPLKQAGQAISVEVVPPDPWGPGSGPSKLGQSLDWRVGDRTLARIYHQRYSGFDGERERITLALRATADEGGDPTGCPAGSWRLRLSNLTLPEGTPVDLTVQRDDPVTFRPPMGRQAYFDHPDYLRVSETDGRSIQTTDPDRSPITRSRTINAYACRSEVVVAGGYRLVDGNPAWYSAAGPTAADLPKPDLSAPCEDSAIHRGRLASGTYSGTTMPLNGTSVAAPAVARAIADAFAEGMDAASVIANVAAAEVATNHGSPSEFAALQSDRHGLGRLAPPKPPVHRRRFE